VCPSCRSADTAALFGVRGYLVCRCRNCTAGFVSPLPTSQDTPAVYDDQYAGEYLKGVMHSPAFAQARALALERALRQRVPEICDKAGRKALDIGCGSGRFLAALRSAGWQTLGVEMSARLASFARERLGLEVVQADFLALGAVERQDMITMFHIIEHLVDPLAALRTARDLLEPGGVLFVETPNWESIGAVLRGAKWSHFIPPEHIVYYGPRAIRRLGESCGFETVMCRTTTPYVIESTRRLPRPIAELGRGAYNVASRLGIGPALQYMGLAR
jgi:SAM-dependent methyltransferase